MVYRLFRFRLVNVSVGVIRSVLIHTGVCVICFDVGIRCGLIHIGIAIGVLVITCRSVGIVTCAGVCIGIRVGVTAGTCARIVIVVRICIGAGIGIVVGIGVRICTRTGVGVVCVRC